MVADLAKFRAFQKVFLSHARLYDRGPAAVNWRSSPKSWRLHKCFSEGRKIEFEKVCPFTA